MKDKIEARLKEIEALFPKLQQELEVKRQEVMQLNGEYLGLSKLLNGDKIVELKK